MSQGVKFVKMKNVDGLLAHSNKIIKKLLKWFLELPLGKCPKCNKKGIYFYYEEPFTFGNKNVYCCKYCKECFV